MKKCFPRGRAEGGRQGKEEAWAKIDFVATESREGVGVEQVISNAQIVQGG